jgi:hypothetical protein
MAGIANPAIPLAVLATNPTNQRAATFQETVGAESSFEIAISEYQSEDIS